mmetsp:Transcript_6049/g.18987  ORF Transcript_6049/g.18987 Transcript_6049/m.18987 type:complete len:343 (-) Transcript_6049:164-1192(-)
MYSKNFKKLSRLNTFSKTFSCLTTSRNIAPYANAELCFSYPKINPSSSSPSFLSLNSSATLYLPVSKSFALTNPLYVAAASFLASNSNIGNPCDIIHGMLCFTHSSTNSCIIFGSRSCVPSPCNIARVSWKYFARDSWSFSKGHLLITRSKHWWDFEAKSFGVLRGFLETPPNREDFILLSLLLLCLLQNRVSDADSPSVSKRLRLEIRSGEVLRNIKEIQHVLRAMRRYFSTSVVSYPLRDDERTTLGDASLTSSSSCKKRMTTQSQRHHHDVSKPAADSHHHLCEKKQRQKTNSSSNENGDFDTSEKKNNTYSRSSAGGRATQKPKKTTCLFKVSLKYLL